jgi:hypothetical protein
VIEIKIKSKTCLATPNPSGPGWVIHIFDARGVWSETGTKADGYSKNEALRLAQNIRRRLRREAYKRFMKSL